MRKKPAFIKTKTIKINLLYFSLFITGILELDNTFSLPIIITDNSA